jgi:hypothetical protein
MTPKQIYERIRVNYRDAFQFISFGIHRYAKYSSLRNKNGLRFGNLTPSPILPNLRIPAL